MATKINWTDETWNVVVGCTKCSPGCDNCYAERMARRQIGMGTAKYKDTINILEPPNFEWSGIVNCDEKSLDIPLHWRKPREIFVCSMSDLFHPKVPFEFIHKVFTITQKAYWHKYQILTKRAKRLLEFSQTCIKHDKYGQAIQPSEGKYYHNYFAWPHENIWLGVTVCTPDEKPKIDILRQIPAAVKFISFEPLFRDMGEINLEGIDWVIVGGESGPKARPMHPDWVRSIRDQCQATGVPFFFKQWGEWLSGTDKYALKINTYQGYYPKRVTRIKNTTFYRVSKKKAGCLLDGREHNEYPKQKGSKP